MKSTRYSCRLSWGVDELFYLVLPEVNIWKMEISLIVKGRPALNYSHPLPKYMWQCHKRHSRKGGWHSPGGQKHRSTTVCRAYPLEA